PQGLEAGECKSERHGATDETIPYNVSHTECEWRPTAQNTCSQNRAAGSTSTKACQVTRRYTQPHATNQRRCAIVHLPRARTIQSRNASGIGRSVSSSSLWTPPGNVLCEEK